MKRILSLIFFSVCLCLASAQQLHYYLNYEMQNRLERYLSGSSGVHTAVKPYNMSEILKAIPDSALQELGFITDSTDKFRLGLTKGDFLSVSAKKKKFYFALNPIIDAQVGYDVLDKKLKYAVGYGAKFEANLGRKVSLSFTYQGDFEKMDNQVTAYAQKYGVLAGYRKAHFGKNELRSDMMSGYIRFAPNKYVNLELGNDKVFWGDGYRSLFLSDNASNFPYLKMSTQFWRIKYTYLLAGMRSGDTYGFNTENNYKNFKTKFGSFHYLSVDVAKWMQFGFFESVVWYHADSLRTRGMEISYLIPLAFLRPIEYALGSPDNVSFGISMKFNPNDKQHIYTQILFDDMDVRAARAGKGFYRTKIAAQIGYKAFDIFKLKHLDFQTELNIVRPYVYAHKSPQQNYANFNQSLAHPAGANFMESLVFVNYWYKHWTANLKFQYLVQGLDEPFAHNGSNIFISDYMLGSNLNQAYGKTFLQGVKTRMYSVEARGGYLINPKINLSTEAFLNFRYRENKYFKEQNLLFGISLRTNIFNRYTDF